MKRSQNSKRSKLSSLTNYFITCVFFDSFLFILVCLHPHTEKVKWGGKKPFLLSVREQMTPQAISIVTMAANLYNALFAINAAESSNSFWRKINAICQNSCLQMFKQAGLSAGVERSVDSHQPADLQPDDCKVEVQSAL